jgi:hypothetical protein
VHVVTGMRQERPGLRLQRSLAPRAAVNTVKDDRCEPHIQAVELKIPTTLAGLLSTVTVVPQCSVTVYRYYLTFGVECVQQGLPRSAAHNAATLHVVRLTSRLCPATSHGVTIMEAGCDAGRTQTPHMHVQHANSFASATRSTATRHYR